MQFSIIATLVAVASIANSVAAENCKKGYLYCGSTLLRRGDYWNDIVRELARHGQHGAEMNALFTCGNDGAIYYVQMCGTCHDGGWEKNDYC